MKRAIIIANGSMQTPSHIASLFQDSDLIIAADGGAQNCKTLGIQPDVIIGDLDSIDSQDVIAYQAAGLDVIRYPAHKDETDLELALQYAAKNEMDEVIIIGALGARWDMTFANVLLSVHPLFARQKIRFLDGKQELVLLHPGEHAELCGMPGDALSLIPLGGDAQGVTTHGLEYPLRAETLRFGSSRGVSNEFLRESADVFFTQGLLLCVLDRRST